MKINIDEMPEDKEISDYPDEFITLPFVVGKTFDKSTGKYVETRRLQIKYNEKNGAHIFPVKET